jgi:hypothetical protein
MVAHFWEVLMRDFYGTVAQVLPVLLLAWVFDSGYLDRLRGQRRSLRRDDPAAGVLFWTKPRVRAYAVFVAVVVLVDTGLCLLVLADGLADSIPLRALVGGGAVIALGSLLFRIGVRVVEATRAAEPADDPGDHAPDSQDN